MSVKSNISSVPVAMAVLAILGFVSGMEIQTRNFPKGLTPIGEFDNKSYFTDREVNLTHAEAAVYCRGFGMALVTFTSVAEHDYVKSILSPGERYWTSAIDTTLYKWDLGNGQIVDEYMYPIHEQHTNCLLMTSHSLISDPCDGSLGFVYFPLCQSIQARV